MTVENMAAYTGAGKSPEIALPWACKRILADAVNQSRLIWPQNASIDLA